MREFIVGKLRARSDAVLPCPGCKLEVRFVAADIAVLHAHPPCAAFHLAMIELGSEDPDLVKLNPLTGKLEPIRSC